MENVKMTFDDKLNSLKNTLIMELSNVDRVFITPHNNMDFDALAAATALYEICNEFSKETYIVTNDTANYMEASLKVIYKKLKPTYDFINTEKLKTMRDNNDKNRDLLILVDTNKINLIPINDIETFDRIIIIDHHKTDENTVKTDKTLIDTEISSASEIVFNLIKLFNIKIDEDLAQRLLAGIYLDTARLSRNFKKGTSKAVADLLELGADSDEANNLFLIANFESDRASVNRINKLIDCTKFSMYNIAISINEEAPDTIYTQEELAKAADNLLQYDLDAAFVIGFVDKESLGEGHKDLIAVKARSKNKGNMSIDVSEVMRVFSGGGDQNRAACIINSNDIIKVKEAICYIMKPGVTLLEESEETEKVLTLMRKRTIS